MMSAAYMIVQIKITREEGSPDTGRRWPNSSLDMADAISSGVGQLRSWRALMTGDGWSYSSSRRWR